MEMPRDVYRSDEVIHFACILVPREALARCSSVCSPTSSVWLASMVYMVQRKLVCLLSHDSENLRQPKVLVLQACSAMSPISDAMPSSKRGEW